MVFHEWEKLQYGEAINLVIRVIQVDPQRILAVTLQRPQRSIVVTRVAGGDFDETVCEIMTILDGKVGDLKPHVVIELGLASHFLPLKICRQMHLQQVVEICCGAGFFSHAALQLGLKVVAGVDHNPRWKSMFETLHEGSVFIEGDCLDAKVILRLHELDLMHSIFLAGVSCQPHSVGGDRRGLADPRSVSLPGVLQLAWLFQCPMLILECVPGVLTDSEVQAMLKRYCDATSSCISQQVLHLSDSWCSFRDRWFAIITSPMIGCVKVPPMPSLKEFQTVSQVMPFVAQWPLCDFEQIHLTLYELSKFHEFSCDGISARFLKANGKMPTSLHSAANQLYPCQCGCRQSFSMQRLKARGLFGTLVPLGQVIKHDGCDLRDCRYLHPLEMLLLNGGLVDLNLGSNHRLSLSAIGQAVSPLQGMWVIGHVLSKLRSFLLLPPLDPQVPFREYIAKVLNTRDRVWQPLQASSPIDEDETHDVQMWDMVENVSLRFECRTASPSVHDFQKAHHQLTGRPIESLQVFDDAVCLQEHDMLLERTALRFGIFPKESNDQIHMCDCPCAEWPPDIREPVSPTIPFSIATVTETQQNLHRVATDASSIVNTPAAAEHLVSLPADGLLELVPPKIVSNRSIDAFLDRKIPMVARLEILEKQEGIWADDEIRFQLQTLVSNCQPDQNVLWWDPMALSSVVRYGDLSFIQIAAQDLPQQVTIVSALVIDQHWCPIVWRRLSGELHAFTCGHLGQFSAAISMMHSSLCKFLGASFRPVNFKTVDFRITDFCGAISILFCEHLLCEVALPNSLDELRTAHHWYRGKFISALENLTERPWIWGQGDQSWKVKLSELLGEHGVGSEDLNDRVALVVSTLGEGVVSKLMKATSPWRELKWAANRCVPLLQLVRPSELQVVLDAKVAAGKPIGTRAQKKHNGKGGGKGSLQQVLDPGTLRLETGLFVCGDSTPLAQIELAHVTPSVSGVALCKAGAAMPYLKGNRQISSGGLALIVVDTSEPLSCTALAAQKVRVPVLCSANNEPLILEGILYQLGSLPVTRADGGKQVQLQTVQSCVTKIMLFRDQVGVEWDRIVAHPLQSIFALIPLLQPCTDDECDQSCEAWHPNENFPIREPILELWGKQWLLENFVAASPQKAELFAVHVRLPHCLQQQIQTYSGQSGVYLEPKDIDGKSPSPVFQIVWMPKKHLSDLTILKQSIQGICGIARMNGKYGFRCHVNHVERIHAQVKPDSSFLPQGRKSSYLIGPAPFGTIKSSVVEVINGLPWKARVLNPVPAGAGVEGMMWKVQAIEPPPVRLIPSMHGDMVITKCDDPVVQVPPKQKVVAASHTLQLCTSGKGEDPWANYDPWSASSKKGTSISSTVISQDPLQAIEQRMVESVIAKLPKQQMEVDEDASSSWIQDKVHYLESQVAELQAGQNRLQHSFQESAIQTKQQIGTLHQQGVTLEKAVQDSNCKLASFQQQFHAQLEQQQSTLDGLFRQQFDQIEALFQKRARHE